MGQYHLLNFFIAQNGAWRFSNDLQILAIIFPSGTIDHFYEFCAYAGLMLASEKSKHSISTSLTRD
jgi:hypothetical protein